MATAGKVAWRNCIVGHGEEAPDQLLANPRNWRIHPKAQQDALGGVLSEVGWVQEIIVNQRTGHVVDGHLRVALAISRGEEKVPVLYVDLSEDEEALILATLDPLAGMAVAAKDALAGLLQDVTPQSDAVRAMLEGLGQDGGGQIEGQEARLSLVDRFLVPPFSVLDARQGYWQERKQKWLALGIEGEIGRTVRVYHDHDWTRSLGQAGLCAQTAGDGTSIFDPVLCELVYRWFCLPDGSILDPFAGGSVRGIVASVLGRQYTGVDLSAAQIVANEEQAATITPDNPPAWLEGDGRDVASLAPGGYDLLFSCPPYGNLEVYSDDPRDLSTMEHKDFLAAYREIVKASLGLLRNNRFACFVVGDFRDRQGFYRNFVSQTIAAFEDAGARLYNEAVLVQELGSLPIRVGKQFESGRKLGKTHQNVLVFVKGDPKRATAACGEVEVSMPEDGDQCG